MSLIIVSGLSGSGKTIALQALEDLGIYCIDNLPASLLPHFAEQLRAAERNGVRQAAVGIDARNRTFLDALPDSLTRLRTLGMPTRTIFLEADEAALIKRFKETRRRHPLTDPNTPLMEGIQLERKLLEPLAFNPAIRIDTTHTTPHELRTRVQDFARGDEAGGMTLLFESFGFKKGTPLDADYVFDVRCLPNPHWQPELRPFTGRDPQVAVFLERHPEVQSMFEDIARFVERWLPRFEEERRSYLTVAVGCTGGQHRSVYFAERLAAHFAGKGIRTQIRHRELA
jgi:RNase adapter protein RapZ